MGGHGDVLQSRARSKVSPYYNVGAQIDVLPTTPRVALTGSRFLAAPGKSGLVGSIAQLDQTLPLVLHTYTRTKAKSFTENCCAVHIISQVGRLKLFK